MLKVVNESHFLEIGKHKIHIKVFGPGQPTTLAPILAIHGSVEDGRIFYSKSGRGLAPWLAQQGYTIYVPDLRGRGKSTPGTETGGGGDQVQMLQEDLPALINYVKNHSQNNAQHWLAHSWGGVQFLAYLAKYTSAAQVKSMCFFGSKRHIASRNWRKWFMVNVAWVRLGEMLVKKYGYLPAINWKMGSQNEHAELYRQTRHWVMSPEWKDQGQDFDYSQALQMQKLPATLLLTGAHDWVLGNPADVARLKREMGNGPEHKLQVFGINKGHSRNYGHIDLLTHPQAATEVFPEMLKWLQQHA